MPKAKHAAARARRRKRLTSWECPACGASMKMSSEPIAYEISGEACVVAGIEHRRCTKCENKLLTPQNADLLDAEACKIYRKRHGLLSCAEIVAIRRKLKLTQAELAALLGLGDNTLSRWESGFVIQSKVMDTLLRLLRDVRGTLPYLRKPAA